MVRKEDLPKAMAINQTASTLGTIAGPALAGVLVGQFGIKVPLLIDAGTYAAIVLAGLLLRTRRGGKRTTELDATTAGTPAAAWRLRSDTLLTTMLVGAAVTVAAITAVNVADVFFVRESLGASETVYGLLGAIWTATMLIGSWLAARAAKRAGDGSMALGLIGLLGGTSVVILLCAAVPDVGWLVPLFVVGGILNGGENVVASVTVARRVPSEARGRAIGAFVGIVNTANVIGFLGGGLLLGLLSPRQVLATAGLAGVLAVVLCLPPILRVVRREARVTLPAPVPAASVVGD
jgi:MFS family permease